MDNTKLHATHKRLTIVFTAMVFVVVFVFGITAISIRYYGEQRIQKKQFEQTTQNVLQKMSAGEKVFPLASERQKQRIQEAFRKLTKTTSPEFVSYFILDEENRVVVDNILEKPDFENVVLDKEDIFYVDDETMIRVTNLQDSLLGEKVIFYKKQRYSWEKFIYDIIGFSFVSLLLAVALYFVGYRFVGKALRPVRENLQDMSEFIHNAGHELKTPLAVIRGNLQVMQAEKKFDTKLIAGSMVSIDHTNELIESLRELSEVGKLSEKQTLTLVWEIEAIQEKFHDMIREKNIEFLGLTSEKHQVFANRHELQLLLSNLIKNAIKYTPKGGKIEVHFEKNKLSISDTGIGISSEEKEKIFERFYQGSKVRSGEGYGIGLSLVKKIADANGWKIELESKPGKGSTFSIVF